MTVDQASVEAALRAAAPQDLQARVPGLAAVVTGLANGTLTDDDARGALAHDAALLESLSGKAVNAGRALVDFKGTVAGQITVGDVAGRDLYNITVNVGVSAVQIGERTELFEVESGLVGVLNAGQVDEPTLDYAAEAVGLTLSGTLADRRWALAAKLLRTDLASLVEAANRLAPQLCAEAGTLVTRAAPFVCVDPAALPLVRQAIAAVPVRHGLGLNSSTKSTGFMYVDAACPKNPKWARAEVPGGWGSWDELEASVAAALKEALDYLPDDDLELVQNDLPDNPVVLVFTNPGLPTPADVTLLRGKGYAPVSFFLLAGDTSQAEFTSMGFQDVVYLPELNRAREDQDAAAVANVVKAAKRACPGRDR